MLQTVKQSFWVFFYIVQTASARTLNRKNPNFKMFISLLTCSSLPRLNDLKLQETDAAVSDTGWLDLKVHLRRTFVPLTAVSSLGVYTSIAKARCTPGHAHTEQRRDTSDRRSL